MTMLLLLHEKIRLTRRREQLTRKSVNLMHRQDRVKKRIENIQKLYSKKIANIDSQAKTASSGFSVFIDGQFGLSTAGLNPFAYASGGGMTQFLMMGMAQWAASGTKDKDGNEKVSPDRAAIIWAAAQQGGFTANNDDDGKPIQGKEYKAVDGTPISKEEYQAFQAAMAQVQQMQQMAQYQKTQMTQQFQTNVSIWQEAAKEELEAEQDEMLAPLSEMDEELQVEKDSVDTELELVKGRLDSIKSALSDSIQDATPKFGLN